VEFYEELFGSLKDKTIRLLEIGVFEGAPMRLWEAYFPAGQIFGIDIEDKSRYDSARVKTFLQTKGNEKTSQKLSQQQGLGSTSSLMTEATKWNNSRPALGHFSPL